MSSDNDLPTFRPFSREELAEIENRIFEKKLIAKKRAEKMAKNVAEFGQGARARRMYENDSDEEEEKDKAVIKQNHKLAQGSDLPRRYADFPLELACTPIVDIDPYYRDKKTFMVISKGKSIYRFHANNGLFFLSPFHPMRRVAIMVLVHPVFSAAVILTILANCYVMIQPDNEYTSATEIIFTAIYTYESAIKVFARGFILDSFSYLRDAWNWLDFVVIFMSYVTLTIDLGSFSALRVFRVFRALKSVAVIPGLKTIVSAVMYSVKNLRDVIILTLFILAIFALLGLQIYMGVLSQKCVIDFEGDVMNDSFYHSWVHNETSWYLAPENGKHIMCGNSSGAGKCPEGTTCLQGVGPNPNYGYTSFDNFGSAYLCAFRLMTQDFWENLYQITLRTAGPYHIVFFLLNIFLGSFYLINLILAIVAMSYDDLQRQADDEIRKEAEEIEVIKAAEEAALREAETANQEAVAVAIAHGIITQEEVDAFSRSEKVFTNRQPNRFQVDNPMSPLRPVTHQAEINREFMINSAFEPDMSRPPSRSDLSILNEIIDNVSPNQSLVNLQNGVLGDEDDDDKFKKAFVNGATRAIDILCVWDCAWIWIKTSELLAILVFDPFTELFITLCIAVNVIFMAMDHYNLEYEGMSPFFKNLLEQGNYFFTAIFAIESFAKLGAMSPRHFFASGWNVFDFVIVLLSLVELLADGISGLSVLRSFRLLRVFKLAKSWKSLNDILTIMANSVGALSNLTFVLGIVIFIFAVMGMQLFGQDYFKNVCEKWACEMPRWNFTDFFHSIMIVFRVLCGEWIESMWDCMYISGPACVPYFLASVLVANLVILNLFLALLLSSFSDMGSGKKSDDGEPDKMQIAIERIRRFRRWITGGIMNFFCNIFARAKVAAAEKTVPTALNGSTQITAKGIVGQNGANGYSHHNHNHVHNIPYPQNGTLPPLKGGLSSLADDMYFNRLNAKIGHEMDFDMPKKFNDDHLMSNGHVTHDREKVLEDDRPSIMGFEDQTLEDFYYNPDDEIFVEDCCPPFVYKWFPCCIGNEQSPFWQAWGHQRLLASKLIENKYFETIVLVLILISSFVMTLEDIWFETKPVLIDTLYYLDRILTVVFFLETCLKLFAMGFVAYFGNAWCWLDFIIVGVSLVNFAASLLGAGNISIFKTMRTLRALRPLRAMAKMEGMKVVVNALVGALPSIFNVLLVCLIFWLIFAIIGVNTFMGRYQKCIDTTTGEKFSHEIIPDREACLSEKALNRSVDWVNPAINFDNVLSAYVALFQVATWKGWIDIMNDAIDSVELNKQPHREVNIYMYLYFVAFIILGSFFTLNLLVGVIIDKFNEQKNKGGSSLDAFMTEDQKKYINAMKKASTKKPLKALPRPIWRPQAFVFAVITNKKFDMVIMAFIGLNMLSMMCDHFDQTPTWTMILDNANLFFIVVFTSEMLLKIFALRKYYFIEPWNLFDFIVVLLSLVSLFLSDLIEKYFFSPTLLRIVRVAKIGRVLRLIKGAKGIRTLLFSLVMAFPALINIALLLFLIMFIFAVFGVSLFKNVKIRPGFDDVHNFQTFAKTFTLLFQICTSAGWSDALMAIGDESNCEEADLQTGNSGDCGSYMTGTIYLCIYLVLTFLIIVNMYIAVILENYSQANEDVLEGITDEDYDLFYEIWQEFDPKGTQYISYSQLEEFLDVLEPPLRIPRPNKFKIISLDIPIVKYTNRDNGEVRDICVFCADILDVLTQNFFAEKGKHIEEKAHVEDVKITSFPDRPGYERVSSSLLKQRERYCASVIKRAWKFHHHPQKNISGHSHRSHLLNKNI